MRQSKLGTYFAVLATAAFVAGMFWLTSHNTGYSSRASTESSFEGYIRRR